jgi:Tfp pilus assembly protein PilF
MAASVCGYLAAYALLLPQGWWSGDAGFGPALRRRRDIAGCILAVPFLAATCVAPFLNLPQADARPAGFVNRMASEIVAAAGDRQWLVTDGVADNHILLAAHGAGSGLRTINLADRTDAYRRMLARRFEQPVYRNLIQIGTANFVREWLASEPGSAAKAAVLSDPDLWLAGGLTPVPATMIYVGSSGAATGTVDAMMARQSAFWSGIPAAQTNEMRQPADWLAAHLRRHAGAVANNTGVYLEDIGRTNEACVAYQAARRIDASNLSALLNLGVLLERGFQTADATAIRSDLDGLKRTARQKMRAWTLSRHYGYVRLPELYVQEGLGWVLSGQPGLGVPRLLKAVALAGDPARAQAAQQALAYAYLAQNEPEAGEAVWRSILEKDPSNAAALLGMSRVEARSRRLQQATSYLERAEKAGAPARAVAFDWASLYLSAGQPARARAILERVVDEDPSVVRAWAMLAGISAQERDAHGLDRCLQRLDTMREGQGVAALIRAKVAMDRVDLNAARRHLDVAHKAMPGHTGALELLLKVDMLQAKQDMAKTHAIALLRVRPNSALANYALGAVHLAQGKFDLAEDLLRRSMAEERTPAVLNDLGWLLYRQQRYAEAENMTRESLAMRPDMYQGWDTLAVILMKTGRLAEADEALRKALSLFSDDPAVHLHRAELLLLQGKREAAGQALDGIKDRRDLLPMEDRMRFEDLIRSLKARGQ